MQTIHNIHDQLKELLTWNYKKKKRKLSGQNFVKESKINICIKYCTLRAKSAIIINCKGKKILWKFLK